jgi:uncharacterized membrane protein affecting hemolysin expression
MVYRYGTHDCTRAVAVTHGGPPMQTLRDIPVIWSLYLSILLVSAGALLYASVSYYLYYNVALQKTAVAELESIAKIAGLSSAEALLANDRATAAKSLSALKANKHIASACIFDKKGELFAAFSNDDRQRTGLPGATQNNTHYFDDQNLHLFHDITLNNSKEGSIYIVQDVAKLRSCTWKFLGITILVFVSCMGLIALPSLFLQGIISAPILILAATMQKITQDKDYTFRMLKGTNREMGLLINDFNKMMEGILSHAMSLEKQVSRNFSEMETTKKALIMERQERMKAEHQMENIIANRQEALAGAKRLNGIVPICCSCKKIRNTQGYWLQFEAYLNQYTNAEYSHGLCPECAKMLYPEIQPHINLKKTGSSI